ncbi:metal-sensitive transcriptional regulator [Salicibibacter kimchii]|uniref:metal-sensitive transcriptional regulator n=1 Tax=Salicibibacter kimchii TaxID=2099786 RepID=UPI002699F89B
MDGSLNDIPKEKATSHGEREPAISTQHEKTSTSPKESIQNRLRRIEGQSRGLQQIVENDRSCVDVLVQITAVQSALKKLGIRHWSITQKRVSLVTFKTEKKKKASMNFSKSSNNTLNKLPSAGSLFLLFMVLTQHHTLDLQWYRQCPHA